MKSHPRSSRAGRGLVLALSTSLLLAACSSGGAGSSSSAAASVSGGTAASNPATATPAPAQASVSVGLSQPNFALSPLYVADAKGFWKDENLDVKLTIFNSGTENQQALLGDAITFGAGGYTEPINLTAQGAPTVIFGFIQGALPYRLMTKSSITETGQLPGKVLAISKVGSLTDQLTRIVLKQAGIDPSKITYQQAGGSSARLAALQSGAVDGALLDSPSYELAQDAGMNTLVNLAEELPSFPYEVLYAKKETIEAKADVFVRFLRGFIKGVAYFKDPANEDEVLKIVAEATGQKADDLKLAYESTLKDFPDKGEMQLDGIKQALDGTKEFADIPGVDKVTAEDLYYPDLQAKAAGS
jgi:NitT/TauT family transport system substrate-binding protein